MINVFGVDDLIRIQQALQLREAQLVNMIEIQPDRQSRDKLMMEIHETKKLRAKAVSEINVLRKEKFGEY